MINEGIINATVQTAKEIDGAVQNEGNIDGTVISSGALDGTVTSSGGIDGSVTSTNAIEGDLNNTGTQEVMNEADPIFKSSPAYGITPTDITNWNNKEQASNKVTEITMNSTNTEYPSARATFVFTHDAVNNLADSLSPLIFGLAGEIAKKQDTLEAGDNIEIVENKISVLTASEAEEDNTKPMTSAGVYTQLGNIAILLETI